MDQTAGRFEAMGRYGGPASQQGVNAAGMSALMPYFDQERQRQAQAAAQLPGFDTERFNRINQVGGMDMAQSQKWIDEQMMRHDFDQNQYLDRMQQFGNLLTPGSQYSIQTSQQPGGSPLAGAAGGALMGAAYGGMQGSLVSPGWGTAIGAGLGLLGSYV
jgi:hypothetical protein